jgi:dTDP-4-amino-4,6-dideoxygalactose transaminase
VTPLKATNDLRRSNEPFIDELAEACRRVIEGGWYVLGDEVARFEADFARYCGSSFAIGLANGTDALEIALRAVGVSAGSKVALVANAGGYGTIAVNLVGAEPVYVDVDESTYCMDPVAFEAEVARTDLAAVIVTHLYGQLADVEKLCAIAAAHGIRVIEDCAQAHGARRAGRRAGAWGEIATFSFYPTKNLGAIGDAGAVVTSDPELAERARRLRQYGWSSKYVSTDLHGRNSRIDELQAAVLNVKLPHLDAANARRREVAAQYAELITHPSVTLPAINGEDHVAHLFVLRTGQRESLAAHLRASGVPFDVHYPLPDYRQPMFADRFAEVSLAGTEALCDQVLTLPAFPELTREEIDMVATAVNRWRP